MIYPKYIEYPVSLGLSNYVECYWTLEAGAGFFADKELIIPGGRAEIVLSFRGSFNWYNADNRIVASALKNFIMGQRNCPFFIHSTGHVMLLGIRFKQGGISSFIDNPVSEITNSFIPIDELFGNEAAEWVEKLNEEQSIHERIRMIENILLSRLKESEEQLFCTKAMFYLKQPDHQINVDSFCSTHQIYYKKLERTFLKITGYPPKNLSSINRLYKALHLARNAQANLTQISYECGYFDQSHFIRECKKFTGNTPKKLLGGRHTVANLLLEKLPV